MDSYEKKKWKYMQYYFFYEKEYVNKKRTEVEKKKKIHKTSFLKKNKQLH